MSHATTTSPHARIRNLRLIAEFATQLADVLEREEKQMSPEVTKIKWLLDREAQAEAEIARLNAALTEANASVPPPPDPEDAPVLAELDRLFAKDQATAESTVTTESHAHA